MSKKQFLVMTFEAAFEIGPHTGSEISNTLDALRSEGAGRATGSRILESEEEYEKWYSSTDRINEVEIPVPQIVQFD